MIFKDQWINMIHAMQDKICDALEKADGKAVFIEDRWERDGGGGGLTRVISNGKLLEKGGVNTSVVFGSVTDAMRRQLDIEGQEWFACGLSLVLHPFNPFVPTVHCNYRMFELYDEKGKILKRWFGGGTDLTPYYLFEEDAVHFHSVYKRICDDFNLGFYPVFKKACDDYFVNSHRNNERRGIGGIFYDHQRSGVLDDEQWLEFAKACAEGLLDAYIPITEKRKDLPFGAKQKYWQEIRRGRYVEFNLIHDRGTIFGLKTNGRTESILMSLPPTVRFDYDFKPEPGSEEERVLEVCMRPVDWVSTGIDEKELERRSNIC